MWVSSTDPKNAQKEPMAFPPSAFPPRPSQPPLVWEACRTASRPYIRPSQPSARASLAPLEGKAPSAALRRAPSAAPSSPGTERTRTKPGKRVSPVVQRKTTCSMCSESIQSLWIFPLLPKEPHLLRPVGPHPHTGTVDLPPGSVWCVRLRCVPQTCPSSRRALIGGSNRRAQLGGLNSLQFRLQGVDIFDLMCMARSDSNISLGFLRQDMKT